jgi:putative DNA primase/helicase
VRTAEEIANEQTAEQLALRIWAATVGEKVLEELSPLMDALLESHLLDDDDEEADEGWLDDQHKREKKILDEAIAEGLDKYPDIAAVDNLQVDSDSDIADVAKQLKTVLATCAIGATKFKERFSHAQLERMVKRDLETRFKKDTKYSQHVRNDVPGSDIKNYGSRGCTSSKGTFVKVSDYGAGGWLDALLTGGWMRVAKDRIDPVAWSHRYGLERKTERQNWRHHFCITERNGHQSLFELPREKLTGSGASAIKLLMKAGVHVVGGEAVPKALAQFLRFKPKNEIIRMSRVGWAQVGDRQIFVRPVEVITPLGMSRAGYTKYLLDTTSQHGLHVAGTTAEWATEIAAPLEGNSNVALSFGTFFAAPLLEFASEPGGGNHIWGRSTIGKTMASAAGQSINGWPYETDNDAFGVSWGGTEAGFDALALAHTDLGLPLDEITLANRRTAEQVVYKVASGTKGPRATSAGHLRETAHASVLVLSTGEKSLAQFIGPSLQEGARKRLVDVPAEVQLGSAFETIPCERIHIEGRRLFDAMKRQHGAVGRDWQRHLVELGPNRIEVELDRHREAFRALSEVVAVEEKAHPQVRAVVNRFALYAAALRMAIEADLLPWSIENADTGIVACMGRWAAQRGNVDEAGEIVRAARQVETALLAKLNASFIHIRMNGKAWVPATEADTIKQQTPKDFDGYVKPDRILIRREAWHRYCNGVDPADVARFFKQRGALIADDNGISKSEQVFGTTERFYVFARSSLVTLTA